MPFYTDKARNLGLSLQSFEDFIFTVIAKYPYLTDFGFGVYDSKKLSVAELKAKIKDEQDELLNREEAFWASYFFLDFISPIKSVNTDISSYSLKHLVEGFSDNNGDNQHVYISNGIFIAAALSRGFKLKVAEPNCYFNFGKKSINYAKSIAGRK